MWSTQFWKDALERAIKTAAQTLLASWGGTAIVLDGAQWKVVGLTVAGATVASLLTSIVSSKVGSDQTASLVDGRGVGK